MFLAEGKNIKHGGGGREGLLAEVIRQAAPDVVVLSSLAREPLADAARGVRDVLDVGVGREPRVVIEAGLHLTLVFGDALDDVAAANERPT